jgi:hypothetical protein
MCPGSAHAFPAFLAPHLELWQNSGIRASDESRELTAVLTPAVLFSSRNCLSILRGEAPSWHGLSHKFLPPLEFSSYFVIEPAVVSEKHTKGAQQHTGVIAQ